MAFLGKWLVTAALAAMVATPASSRCWNDTEAAAAKARELDVMLMVSALRCRAVTPELLASYNRFVGDNRAVLLGINRDLRGHFGSIDRYDAYLTAAANRYGGGGTESCADRAWLASAALIAGGSAAQLGAVADSIGLAPVLPEGRCGDPVVIATRR